MEESSDVEQTKDGNTGTQYKNITRNYCIAQTETVDTPINQSIHNTKTEVTTILTDKSQTTYPDIQHSNIILQRTVQDERKKHNKSLFNIK